MTRPKPVPAPGSRSSIYSPSGSNATGRVSHGPEVAALDTRSGATLTARQQFENQLAGIILGIDGEGFMVVQKEESGPEAPSSSMFQDSITLTKLRGKLYLVSGLAPSVVETARVRNGTAYLVLPPGTSVPMASAAINAALNTTGVSQVRARLSPGLVAAGASARNAGGLKN